MKTLTLAAAGLMSLTALAPVAAAAQTRVVETSRTVSRTHTGPAFEHHSRRVCHIERHRHRQVRICRTVRD